MSTLGRVDLGIGMWVGIEVSHSFNSVHTKQI